MDIRKAVTAVVLLALGVLSVAAVKNSAQLKTWLGALVGEGGAAPAGAYARAGDEGDDPAASPSPAASTAPAANDFPPFPSEVQIPKASEEPPQDSKAIVLPTTIPGGMVVRNNTSFDINLDALLNAGVSQKLPAEGVQVLIIHTHGSEAYTSDEENSYTPTDTYRTEDKNFNVIRVGDELASCLESFGLNVIHDREIYDYPSYNIGYPKSGAATEEYLRKHPEIAIVIDLHRDALGRNGVVYKTVAEGDGQMSAQVMLVVGTEENGQTHPNWRENLKLALYLQAAMVDKYPSLARPVAILEYRYNQQLTTGSLILEVGSSGNTLSEALQAVRLFADAVGPALLELVEE